MAFIQKKFKNKSLLFICFFVLTFVQNAAAQCTLEINSATPGSCIDGQFFVTFDITAESENSEVFNLIVGNDMFDGLPYGQGTYTVGPVNQSNNGIYQSAVYDPTGDDCNAGFEFETQCEEEICSLTASNFAPINCTGEEVYFIASIESENEGNSGLTVMLNGESYGTYDYEVVNYEFGPFPYFPGEEYVFTFIDNELGGTCADTYTFPAFELENCQDFCFVNLDVLEVTDCNADGQFFIDFQVTTSLNSPSENFVAILGSTGEEFGPFAYGQDFYQIGPLPSDGTIDDFLIVSDAAENPFCGSSEILFSDPECDQTNDCQINIPFVEVGECNADGQFFVDFEMLPIQGEGSVIITGNGQNYGTYDYNLPLYTVGPFDGTETATYELIVTDNENPDCVQILTFASANCNAEDCNMSLTFDEYANCFGENQFFVIVSVTNGNMEEGSFTFSGNGQTYDTEEYGAGSYAVGPFAGNNSDTYEIIVTDGASESCSDFIEFQSVDCPISDCFIDNLDVATGECNDQGSYLIIIDFEYNDIGGETFTVTHENEIIGNYTLEDLPVSIQNFDGNDETESLMICMDEAPDCCAFIDFLTPQCGGLITWPGDANFDGITNNMDILNLGIAFNATGPERAENNVNWDAQNASSWQNNFINGVNYAHADTDGNGQVNMDDTTVITTNYDLTHDEVTPFEELESNESSPALFVDMPDPFELQQGMAFTAPIIFGLEDLPVSGVYGLAFTLRYDPEIIDPGSINLEYPISWMGFPQTNLMTFDYHDIDLGEIDVAITKIDQNNVSGWGEILNFIGIIDNIAGKAEVFIEIENVSAILSNETRFPVNTPLEITTITSTDNVNELQGFDLFPNPTNAVVYIKNETGLTLQNIEISDLNGKILQIVKGENSFDLSALSGGVYLAKIVFEGKTVYRKIVRM